MGNKILFVIGLVKSGGAEKRAIYTSNILKDTFDTRVFAFSGPKTNEIDYVFKDSYSEYKKESARSRIIGLRKVIDEYKPQIIISFLPHINCLTTLALKKKKYKNIKHVIGIAFCDHAFKSKMMLKYSISRCQSIFFQCNEQVDIIKHGKKDYFVAENPIKISKEIHHNTKYHFMSCGRLEDQKDYILQIKAFSLIKKKHQESILDIYGSGSQKELLNNLVEQSGLKDSVFIHEYTDNINEAYTNHDIFLFTSKAEGFPNVIGEAMANGLLSFSTHFRTGCDDLLINGKTGFVCNSRDPEAYANMVIDNIQDEENVSKVIGNAREHIVSLCSPEIFKVKIVKELNKLLEE